MQPSELNVLENAIVAHLEAIFGAGTVADDLPEFVNQSISWVICELAPAFSPVTFQNIRAAVAYLYPPNPHYPFDPTEEPPTDVVPPTWRQIAALLRLWALLISDDTRISFQVLTEGDFSLLENYLVDKGFDTPLEDRTKLRFIMETVALLHQAKDEVFQAESAAPVSPLGKREIIQLAEQWKYPNPFGVGYYLLHNRLQLSIDYNQDIENIMAAVRLVVEKYHMEMSRDHAANWNDEERRIWGDEHIKGLDPVKGFTYKPPGDKRPNIQFFTGEAAEALLVFALRRRDMTPTEINKRFFPKWCQTENEAARLKAKRNTDRYNLAGRLICNARSGVAMQS